MKNKFIMNSETLLFNNERELSDKIKDINLHIKNIKLFEDVSIFYDDKKAIDIYSKNIRDKDLYQTVLLLLTNYKSFSNDEDFNSMDELEVCKLNENHCLLSSDKSEGFTSDRVKIGNYEINNIFDENSLVSFYRDYGYSNLFLLNINKDLLTHTGFVKNNIKNIYFHDNLNNEFNIAPKEIKKKFERIFIELILGIKWIDSYDYHPEGDTVKNDSKLRQQRLCKFNREHMHIFDHLKLTQDWSIYIKIIFNENSIYFGKLTDHLKTKNY